MFKLYTVIFIILFSSFGFGNDLTGSQCKQSLEPINQLRTNAFLFNDMLSHYSNPLGMRLQNFRLGEDGVEPGSRVHTYIRNVREAIISCPQNCNGIVSNRGADSQSVFNCSEFSQMNVLEAVNRASTIADDDTNEAVEEEEPEDEEDPRQHFTDVDLDDVDVSDEDEDRDNAEVPDVVVDNDEDRPEDEEDPVVADDEPRYETPINEPKKDSRAYAEEMVERSRRVREEESRARVMAF